MILLGIGFVAILHQNAGNTLDVFILLIGVIPIFIAIGFNYGEKTEAAGAIIGTALAVMITILASIGQGVYDIGTMAYPAILIIARLFLKRNTVVYLTVLIILCNGWLFFGAIYGIYQPIYPEESFFRQVIINSLILLITMFAVHVLSNTVRHSLSTAQSELRERKMKNRPAYKEPLSTALRRYPHGDKEEITNTIRWISFAAIGIFLSLIVQDLLEESYNEVLAIQSD